MDKMKTILLILITIIYGLTAKIHLQSYETILSKHPLFIYSVIVLALLVLSLRLQEKAKTILLCIVLFFLGIYYTSLIIGV